MPRQYFILGENHEHILVDLPTWVKWFENPSNRIVKKTKIGDVEVSTIFLGYDPNFLSIGPPIIYETMIFGGDEDFQERDTTRERALTTHERTVVRLRRKLSASSLQTP